MCCEVVVFTVCCRRCQLYLLGNLPCGNWKQGHAVQIGRHAIAAAVVCLTWSGGEVNTEMRTKWCEKGDEWGNGWLARELSVNSAKKIWWASGRDYVSHTQQMWWVSRRWEGELWNGRTSCKEGWQAGHGRVRGRWKTNRTFEDWGRKRPTRVDQRRFRMEVVR